MGVAHLEAGDDIGDELLARFRRLRGNNGDMSTGWLAWWSLRQRTRSLGDWCTSSLGASDRFKISCQVGRLAGVTALLTLLGAGTGGEAGLEVRALGASGALLTVSGSAGRGSN